MKVPVPDEILPADRLGRVHFVGIGGAGLSGIARIMLARGMTVSGSDGVDTPTLGALRVSAPGRRRPPRRPRPRRRHARGLDRGPRGQPGVPRGRASGPAGPAPVGRPRGADVVDRRVVAVAGTHGKTTTTSLLTVVSLQAAGADPTYAVGGDLAQTGRNAHEGAGDLFVAEADESDGAFLVYLPHAAIVTNVEADHLDNWGLRRTTAALAEFVDLIDPQGFLVCVVDDPGAADLAALARDRGLAVVAVGEFEAADVRATGLRFAGTTSTFTVHDGADVLGEITLQIPGRHHVLDALAALAVGPATSFDALRAGLEGFTGTRRRMERKGEAGGSGSTTATPTTPSRSPGTCRPAAPLRGGPPDRGLPTAPRLPDPHLRHRDGRGARGRRRGRRARRLPRP